MEYQGPVMSDLLLWEVLPEWSRDTVKLADQNGKTLARGTVLAVADGEYSPVAAGEEANARAVLIETKKEVGAGETAAVILRGAVVAKDRLIWPEGADVEAGKAALDALGIVAREKL